MSVCPFYYIGIITFSAMYNDVVNNNSKCVLSAVYNFWVRMHSIVFCVGEGNRYARVQEHVQACGSQIACGRAHLVSCNHFPFLRSNKLSRWITSCKLHRLHYPCSCPHLHFQICSSPRGKSFFHLKTRDI